MKLELRSRGVRLTTKLRNHIERSVRFSLARFGDRVRRVKVSLKDVNGPKGGEDIECHVHAELAPGGALVIQSLKKNPFAAVATATKRTSRRVSRYVDRLRTRRQGRHRGSS